MTQRKPCFSLTNRLRATAILPALIVSVIMGITVYTVMQNATQTALENNAKKTVETMRVLYQSPLISGDVRSGEVLMRSIMSDNEIITARVFDMNGRLFVEGLSEEDETKHSLRLSERIRRDTLPIDVWGANDEASNNLHLGHIELVVAPTHAIARRNEALLILYAVTILALALSIWLGTRLGRSILTPLKNIGDAVSQMRSGNYQVKPNVATADELGVLSDNTIHLADALTSKDIAIDKQMVELLHSREGAFRAQDENSQLLKDLANEYIDPLVSAIGHLQNVSAPKNSESSHSLARAQQQIEYVLEITEDFKHLIDHNLSDDMPTVVSVNMAALCQSLLASYAPQSTETGLSLVYEQGSVEAESEGVIFADPIRIRVLLKNILEIAVLNAEQQGNITVRSVVRRSTGKAVIVVDVFEDTRHFSDATLDILNAYFGDSGDFIEQEEYQLIPVEYRTARRVAHSQGGNISIKRCLSGGHIISVQLVAHQEPPSDVAPGLESTRPVRNDVFYFRQAKYENRIIERYLVSKGIQVHLIDNLPSLSVELKRTDCQLVFIELNPIAKGYEKALEIAVGAIKTTNASVVALIEPGHETDSADLVGMGFADVVIMPISASHIFSIIKANSSVNTSIRRIFAEQ